ncbi:MAG: PilN domain-containing protein [Hydrogenophilaceae bacterium]|jgi:type IV pilus assembly protein PilN|nr:PilN domain-containing protein [Hydrogenophilaceae bacterium]
MIRINLLPHRELKRAARRRQFNFMLVAALASAIGVAALGQTLISARQANQETRNRYLEQEIAKLDIQIGEIKKIREQTQALLERKQVVETLQSNRTEVVHLFDEMIRQLPEGLYLKAIKQSGGRVQLQGYTQSSARVSSLMRNLDASPWFEDPKLVEIKAATVNNLRANEFNLSVKQTKQQAEGEDKGSQS